MTKTDELKPTSKKKKKNFEASNSFLGNEINVSRKKKKYNNSIIV